MRLPRESGKRANLGSGPRPPVRWGLALGLLTALALLTGLTGCTRRYFRATADRDVFQAIDEKDDFAAWHLQEFHVYPDRRARFADPSDPDHPAMPPDDPAAWLLSPHPQRPKQIAYLEGTGYIELLMAWDAENRARLKQEGRDRPKDGSGSPGGPSPGGDSGTPGVVQSAAGPQAPAAAPAEAEAGVDGVCPPPSARPLYMRKEPFLITFEQAVELGVLNSREFQTAREDLYLAALPVTLERFNFLPQFEATETILREWAGRQSVSGKQNRWRFDTGPNNGLGVTQMFSTGAQLLLRLANETTVNLTGPGKHTISESTVILELSQPLLRGGGRAIALEPLTQAERDLLYELRDYARFHRVFFVDLAGPTTARGYYPTLLAKAQLENNRQNEVAFASLLRLFQAFVEGGSVSPLQVGQIEQQLFGARTTILQGDVNYKDLLDSFKQQLGLPTDLPLELDDSPLRPLQTQMRRFEELEKSYRAIVDELDKLVQRETPPPELRAAVRKALTETGLVQGTRFQREFSGRWESWRMLNTALAQPPWAALSAAALPGAAPAGPQPFPLAGLAIPRQPPAIERLGALQAARRDLQAQIDQLEAQDKPTPPELEERLRLLTLDIDIGALEVALQTYDLQPWLGERTPARRQVVREELFRRVSAQVAKLLEEARAEKIRLTQEEWPKLPPVLLAGKDLLAADEEDAENLAGQVALANRLDLMNQRAQVVDAWRQIAVSANALLGTLDLRYHFDARTPSGQAKPLDFEGRRSRHQLILNTELPLVRRLERNNYRRSLVFYQRERRALMDAEDQVLFDIRQSLRTLRRLAQEYRIQQRQLQLAYNQVDNSLETLRAPPDPNAQRDAAASAAALTQQLVNAQSSVPRAQNALLSAWVQYVTTRMRLYRDLELLQVDTRGVWIDEYSAPAGPRTCGTEPAPGPASR